ncbi:hypothetical protein ACWEK5_05000 [Rhodococcus koreensis]
MGALVSTFLTNLHDAVDVDTVSTSRVLEDAIVDLLSAALHAEVPPSGAQEPALLRSAMPFIEDNFDDTTLDTALVASRHHVSTRYLQKTFEAAGHTIAGWIRNRRLEKCHHVHTVSRRPSPIDRRHLAECAGGSVQPSASSLGLFGVLSSSRSR